MDFTLKITSIPYKRNRTYYATAPKRKPGRPPIDRDKLRSAAEIVATTNLQRPHLGLMKRTGWRSREQKHSYNHIQQFFDDVGHKQIITWAFLKSMPCLKDIKKA